MFGRKNGMVWTFLGVLAIKQGQLAPGLPFCTGTAIVCGALAMPCFADDGGSVGAKGDGKKECDRR